MVNRCFYRSLSCSRCFLWKSW